MSGLWDWWRRVRGENGEVEEEKEEEEEEEEGGLKEKGGGLVVEEGALEEKGGGLEVKGAKLMEEDGALEEKGRGLVEESSEEEKEYAELEELVKEDTASSENDYDEVAEVPRESVRPDGQECREEVEKEGREEEGTDEEWSEDEEWERAYNDCLVPKVVLSLGLRSAELGQLRAMEAAAQAVLQPPQRLHSASARLAPVYATVIKNRVLPSLPPATAAVEGEPPPDTDRDSVSSGCNSSPTLPPDEEGLQSSDRALAPREDSLPLPESVLAPREDSLKLPNRVLAPHEEILPLPDRVLAPREDSLQLPDRVLAPHEDILQLPDRVLVPHEDILPITDRVLAPHEDSLPLPERVLLRNNGSLPLPDRVQMRHEDSQSLPDRVLVRHEDSLPPLDRVPPPLPDPDWEEEQSQPWRPGRLKKMRKWIGDAPNRISRILSQDHLCHQGQSGFEDLRRYIKQGGDFCKELTAILQERSEAEAQFGKTLAKLSSKLVKATKEGQGTVNAAWHRIASEMEAQADVHRNFATSLAEEVVRPLKQLVDSQHRIRKSVETAVDKSGKNLSEWRAAESKAKKTSFTCARENEKLREGGGARLSSSALHLPPRATPEKETAKMETKRRKAEECVKKADVEYYSVCLRAERSRLEWESAVLRGSHCFQVLEEERLRGLKDLASSYLSNFTHIGPKITQISDRLSEPIKVCDLNKDLETVITLKAATEPSHEQILPDFYPEHTTLAMNRERRKMALVKLLDLIRSDLERERRGKAGVENLAIAMKRTPTFASEDSQQNVQDKLHHMRSMLTYLEAARYKLLCVLSELEGRTRPSHPLAEHIHVSRDRQGYQHSVLKVPSWIHTETEITDWVDRGTADGTSAQPDSDFDEFSSQGSEKDYEPVVSITNNGPTRCRALYNYTANLYDELSLNPGDIINIHDKQPDGWWLGELNGVVGIFPATYVEEIK